MKLAFRTAFDEMQNDNPNITLNFSILQKSNPTY